MCSNESAVWKKHSVCGAGYDFSCLRNLSVLQQLRNVQLDVHALVAPFNRDAGTETGPNCNLLMYDNRWKA